LGQVALLQECILEQNRDTSASNFSLNDFSATVVDGKAANPRGIFQASYPPTNSDDLLRLYLTSDKSIYRNIPCPDVYLTPDK
jgi:hypothetical protein